MIKLRDSPEGYLNKFISREEEGMRGILLAVNDNSTQAIMLATNSAFDKSVQWGRMYLVQELNPKEYPRLVKRVQIIPHDFSINNLLKVIKK